MGSVLAVELLWLGSFFIDLSVSYYTRLQQPSFGEVRDPGD
jgi:hypothetical protein